MTSVRKLNLDRKNFMSISVKCKSFRWIRFFYLNFPNSEPCEPLSPWAYPGFHQLLLRNRFNILILWQTNLTHGNSMKVRIHLRMISNITVQVFWYFSLVSSRILPPRREFYVRGSSARVCQSESFVSWLRSQHEP